MWRVTTDNELVFEGPLEPVFHPGFMTGPEGNTYGLLTEANTTVEFIPEVEEAPRRLLMDVPAFFLTFTAIEEANIRDFAAAEPTEGEPAPVTQGRRALKVMLDRLEKASNVNMTLPQNQAGIDLLVGLGLLTADRGIEIKKGALVY